MKNLIFSSEEEGFTEDDTQQLKQVTPDTMISLNIQCILFVELIYVVVQFNPFAPEPPVQIHVLSTLCDVISFNGQGQLCLLTCAEWRDLSIHTRMSIIQSRTPEKEAKNHVTLTWKSPRKSCSIAHLPFLLPNPEILKGFRKTIPTKMKPTKCPAREKKMRQESEKRGEERKTAVSLLNPKFCACPNFASWYFASGSEGCEVYDV